MEIKSIEFIGDDGWQSFTDYNYTPSSELHIPRVGDKIENSYGNTYTVEKVFWILGKKSVVITCNLDK